MSESTEGAGTTSAAEEAKTALEVAKLKAELLETESPLAKTKREVEAQKAIAEAHQQTFEAQQKQYAALLPDFGKVTPGSFEVKGETALFGPALAQRATAAAAEWVAEHVGAALSDPAAAQILVTSDTQLAASDAVYLEVVSGLDQLTDAADKLAEALGAPPLTFDLLRGEPSPGVTEERPLTAQFALGPAIAAISSVLPGILSLAQAHRTLSTSANTADSLAAAAAVAGGLAARKTRPGGVFHDDIRLLPAKGIVQGKLTTLGEKRQELVDLKRTLEERKAAEAAQLAELKAEVEELSKQLGTAKKAEREDLEPKLKGKRDEATSHETEAGNCSVRVDLIDSTVTAIDKFTASMTETAAGATHSPFTAAILREQLHGSGDGEAQFTHVVLVVAEPGSAQQLTEDRPLLMKDTFTTVATSSVTYMLIEAPGGNVLRAGSVGGKAKVEGKVGSTFSVTAEAVSATG
jgi:hypothetical protein